MLKKILAIVAMLVYSVLAMAAVDANKATEAELDSVKGIGPGTTKLIVDERKKGDFKSWEDFISRVKGVGEKRAHNLSEAGLTIGGKAYAAKDEKKDAKAAAKEEKKEAKTAAKDEQKDVKAQAKAEKKEAKADAKAMEAKADAKADAKVKESKADAKAKEAKAEAKADEKAAAAKPAASAKK